MIGLNLIRALGAFAVPAVCSLCHTPLEAARAVVCAPCFDRLSVLDPELISLLREEITEPWFGNMFITFEFSAPFQTLIYLLKYRKFTILGNYFGQALAGMFSQRDYDLITAVPLHPVRLRERGFNQSALIAHHLSQFTGMPLNSGLLRRIRNNPSQTRLSRESRQRNVLDIFVCSNTLQGLKILLVDDVITTGSTINACCKSLVSAGAERVDVAALATPADFLQRESERTNSGFRVFQEFS